MAIRVKIKTRIITNYSLIKLGALLAWVCKQSSICICRPQDRHLPLCLRWLSPRLIAWPGLVAERNLLAERTVYLSLRSEPTYGERAVGEIDRAEVDGEGVDAAIGLHEVVPLASVALTAEGNDRLQLTRIARERLDDVPVGVAAEVAYEVLMWTGVGGGNGDVVAGVRVEVAFAAEVVARDVGFYDVGHEESAVRPRVVVGVGIVAGVDRREFSFPRRVAATEVAVAEAHVHHDDHPVVVGCFVEGVGEPVGLLLGVHRRRLTLLGTEMVELKLVDPDDTQPMTASLKVAIPIVDVVGRKYSLVYLLHGVDHLPTEEQLFAALVDVVVARREEEGLLALLQTVFHFLGGTDIAREQGEGAGRQHQIVAGGPEGEHRAVGVGDVEKGNLVVGDGDGSSLVFFCHIVCLLR